MGNTQTTSQMVVENTQPPAQHWREIYARAYELGQSLGRRASLAENNPPDPVVPGQFADELT